MVKALLVSGNPIDVNPKSSAIQPVKVMGIGDRSILLDESDITIDDDECGSGRSLELEAQTRQAQVVYRHTHGQDSEVCPSPGTGLQLTGYHGFQYQARTR